MDAPQIFGQEYVYCFYANASMVDLLPVGSTKNQIPTDRPYNKDEYAGRQTLYEKSIGNYDPCTTIEQIRKHLIDEVSFPADMFIRTFERPWQISYTESEVNTINKYKEEIKKYTMKKNKAATETSKRLFTRRVERCYSNLADYMKSLEKKYIEVKKTMMANASVKVTPTPNTSTNSSTTSSTNSSIITKKVSNPSTAEVRPPVEEFESDEEETATKVEEAVMTEAEVFTQLQNLRWADKDEREMRITNLNPIAIHKLVSMFPIMETLANNLRISLAEKTGVIENMSDNDRNNFLFHVIAKGKNMYYQSMVDADFCLYLVDNWQPLYTFMSKKIR